MELIDKSALVVEIEKRFDEYSRSILRHYDACTEARASELGKILVILNTIEVKKVDLEKEFDDYIKNIMDCDVQFEPFTRLYNCAKHFYELGLKAKKGE